MALIPSARIGRHRRPSPPRPIRRQPLAARAIARRLGDGSPRHRGGAHRRIRRDCRGRAEEPRDRARLPTSCRPPIGTAPDDPAQPARCQATGHRPDPRLVRWRTRASKAGQGLGRRVGFHPSGAAGDCDGEPDALAVRAGSAGGDGVDHRAWRGAAADRGVSEQRGCGSAGRERGDQAAQAGSGAGGAGRGPVRAVGRRRRALRGPDAAARGRGAGAAARARPAGAPRVRLLRPEGRLRPRGTFSRRSTRRRGRCGRASGATSKARDRGSRG